MVVDENNFAAGDGWGRAAAVNCGDEMTRSFRSQPKT
jgi:hypothetical protein